MTITKRKRERHGMCGTSEYSTWEGMIARCHNPHDHRFKDYGGRGIKVCERWRTSFIAFFTDMGRRPEPLMSLDRIDNDGNYEPGNVRWSTPREQSNKRRDNHLLTIDGITKTVMEWCREKNISYGRLHRRIEAKWPVEFLFSDAKAFKGNWERRSQRMRDAVTHCPYGHEYTVENTFLDIKGARNCRICERAYQRAYYARTKAVKNNACKIQG